MIPRFIDDVLELFDCVKKNLRVLSRAGADKRTSLSAFPVNVFLLDKIYSSSIFVQKGETRTGHEMKIWQNQYFFKLTTIVR